jgi:hypothetical protein
MFLKKAGDETTDVTIEQLSVSENGTYSEEGVAYSPVIVNVPAPPIPDNAYLLNEVEGLPKDIATFTDGSNLPMPKLQVGIEPIQEGSGDPSPENIRPISGWDEVNVVVSPTTDAEDGTTYTIQFKDGDNPLTVYGGSLDVVNGELKVVPYYDSYNGETLEGEWISDRDVYAVGTTPTIGAQVVNIGATPQTYQLTPTIIKSLQGENNFFADSGEVIKLQYWSKEVTS